MKNNSDVWFANHKHWIDLPVILAPVILMFRALIPGNMMYWGIISLQFIPWHWEALRNLEAGELPLWNIWNGMGAPLLANYQSALLYPPTWLVLIVGWIGGFQWLAWSHGLLIVLHLIWAGLGMRRLVGLLGAGPIPQVICGIAYGLCGYIIARGSFITMVQAASWIPWILLAASQFSIPIKIWKKSDRQFEWKSILYLSMAFTGQWLSGHAQLAWYTLVFCIAWLVTGALVNGGIKQLRTIILPVGISGVLGFLLCSIQLIPTLEYLTQSQRSGVIDYETALSYSFWPWRFLTFLFPDFFGNPGNGDYWGYGSYWEDAIYVGLLPLFFLIISLIRIFPRTIESRNRKYRPLMGFLLVSVIVITILSLGWNTPIFPWLFENIPTFGAFNGPARWMIFFEICLILMAGLGAEEWVTHRIISKKWANLGIAGMIAMMLCVVYAWTTQNNLKESLSYSMFSFAILALGYFVLARIKPKKSAPDKIVQWQSIVVIWFFLDLFWVGIRLNPVVSIDTIFSGIVERHQTEEETIHRFISTNDERNLRFQRFFRFDNIQPSEDLSVLSTLMLPNINALYSTAFFNNFDPMIPDRFQGYLDEVDLASTEIQDRYLAHANVTSKVVVDPFNPEIFKWTSVDAFPDHRLMYCPDFVPGGEDALLRLRKAAAENKMEDFFVLETTVELKDECHSGRPVNKGTINEILKQATRKVYDITENPVSGWLLVSSTWYPGWKATLDGLPVTVYHGNYLFQAVRVPEGNHRIELQYVPMSFILGAGLTGLGVIVFAGLWLYFRKYPGGPFERKY